jgi:hypothetical protein
LLLDGVSQRLVFEFLVLCEPLLELNDLQGIRRGHEHIAQHLVGIERDGRNHRIELVGWKQSRLVISGCRLLLWRVCPGSIAGGERCDTEDRCAFANDGLESVLN